jgi:release factor glutamine methyltransferase
MDGSYSYNELTRLLQKAGVEEAGDTASLLLEHICGATHTELLMDRDRSWQGDGLEAAVTRCLDRYPVQYVLGYWDFYGCRFKVNEHCLIPRPDTEVLVEEAVRKIPRGASVLEIGTGSGCVAIALLRARPDLTVTALEKYPDTLALAVENAERNGVSDRFVPLLADARTAMTDGVGLAHAPYGAIVSNPPYIPHDVIASLEPELSYEPEAALDGGADGLDFYRLMLEEYRPLLAKDGFFLFEIGYDQAQAVAALAQGAVRVIRDLGGNDRVLDIRIS